MLFTLHFLLQISFAIPQDCVTNKLFLRYFKIRSCHKSVLPLIGWKNTKSLLECMQFARDKNGLAFNFSPPEAKNFTKIYTANCQILSCSEFQDSSTLIYDKAFDYYSSYGNLYGNRNATCIKGQGLFQLISEKKNYTEAISHCQNINGDLANVLSQIRTNTLANLLDNLISEWYKMAWIGLDAVENENNFVTPDNYRLDCINFRAWAPGFPRKNHKHEDCVTLDSRAVWRAINCQIQLFFVCELYPYAPVKEDSFMSMECLENSNGTECKKLITLDRLYRKSPRIDKCTFWEPLE